MPLITRRNLELDKKDFLAVLDSTESLVWNFGAEDEKCVNEESKETRSDLKLSPECVRRVRELGIGSVKLSCKLNEMDENKEGEDARLEVMAYIGQYVLELCAISEEKYHCRLLLQQEEAS